MNTPRIALYAAAASVVLWAAKSVAIGLAGGLDRTWLEEPLFLVGLLYHVVAVVALVVWWTRGRHLALRAGAVLAAVVVAVAIAGAIGAVAGAIAPTDPSWVYEEINLWISAPVVLLLAWRTAGGIPHRPRDTRTVAVTR